MAECCVTLAAWQWFHTAGQISGILMQWAIPRAFIKDALQKVKECEAREEGESRGSTWRKRRYRILLAEETHKTQKGKKKVYYWTIVTAVLTSMLIDVKAHIPVLFLGSNSRSDVETTTRNQGRD